MQPYNILLALNLENQIFIKGLAAELAPPHIQGVWGERGEDSFDQTIALKVMVKISLNS